MAIATLTIDIVAKLANLQTSFDKAAQLSEKNAKRIENAFKNAGTVLKTAFAGFGVQQLVQAFNQVVDGLGQFKDVAEKTGIAVEELSKLEPVARQAGLTIADVGELSLKLSKALSGVDDESKGAGKALAQLGIELDSFRRLGAADQVQTLAKALDNFKDDANKAAIGQAILRGEWSKAAGFLKDLAQAGKLNATVTAEQAEAADAYNKQLERLKLNIEGVGRSIVGYIAPRVNNLIEQISRIDWGKVAGAAFGPNGAMLGELGRQAAETGRQLSDERVQAALQGLSDKFKDVTGQGKKSVGTFVGVADATKKTAVGVRELTKELDSYARLLRDERQRAADAFGVSEKQGAAEEARRLAAALDDVRAASGQATSSEIQRWEDLNRLLDEGRISAEQWAATVMGPIEDMAPAIEKTKSVAEELGFTFSSAFEDAIVGAKGLKDILRGLEQDILRIITRQLVTKPLADAIGGIDFGSLLGSLFGGGMASGGPVMGGTPYLVGEKGPELFVPSQSGQIVPNSRMGRSTVINVNVPASTSGATAQQIAATVARTLAIADARLN